MPKSIIFFEWRLRVICNTQFLNWEFFIFFAAPPPHFFNGAFPNYVDLKISFICLVFSISLDHLPGSVYETHCCPLYQIHSYVLLPHPFDFFYQLVPVFRHWVGKNEFLKKKCEIINFLPQFRPTFITPQMQKSKGARSGELGLQVLPPQGSDPSAKVLSEKLALRRASTLVVRWHEAPSFNHDFNEELKIKTGQG